MSKTLTMEIMAPGTWNGFNFGRGRLEQIADNFKSLFDVHKVPLKIGHADEQVETKSNDQHALGWASDVWVTSAGKMVAKFTDVPKVVYDAIKKKLYRKVSVELDFDTIYKGKNLGDVLSGVALLGADIPAVNTIDDLQAFFSSSGFTESKRVSFCTIETDYEKEDTIMSKEIEDLKDEALSLVDPVDANLTNHITTLVEYRDGTHLDVIYQLE